MVLTFQRVNKMYMRNIYLDRNYYLNNRSRFNIFYNILLTYKIRKNNKLFIENNIKYLDDKLDYYKKTSILVDDNVLFITSDG